MDQEPTRLKHQGKWLAAAIDTLESELPSEDQLEQLRAALRSNLHLDESGSGVRKKLLAEAEAALDRAEPKSSRRVKRERRAPRTAPKRPAPERVKPRVQPSWRMVALAAAASALLTLASSSAWRSVPPPTSPRDARAATAAATAAPILPEFVDWPPPTSAPASAPAAPAVQRWPHPLHTVTLESALGPALPEDWESPENRGRPDAAAANDDDDDDLWWLSPEAAGGGRLKLNSIPSSNVSIDGTKIGRTPVVDAWVSVGKHTVTFDHAMFGRKRRVVEVAPGATQVVAVWFGNEPLR